MSIFEIISTYWPIVTGLSPLLAAAALWWLNTKFPAKSDLEDVRSSIKTELGGVEKRLGEKIDEHEERLDAGSKKLADLDKRTALVEEEARTMPTRQTLQAELSNLGQRMAGMERGFEGIGKQLTTQNDYLHTLIERGLK